MPLLYLRPLALFYVDPGSGSLIWQFLAAALFASLFYVRRVFQRLRALKSKVNPAPTRTSAQSEVAD
jgi:hypothetical protein